MESIFLPGMTVVAVVNVLLGAVILSRGWSKLPYVIYGIITLCVAFWAAAIIGFFSFADMRLQFDWLTYTHFFGMTIAYAFAQFAARFPQKIGARWTFALTTPLYLFSLYELFSSDLIVGKTTGISYEIGPLYVFYAFSLFFFFVAGYVLLALQYRHATTDAGKSQVQAVFVSTAISSLLSVIPSLWYPMFGNFSYTWLGPVFTLIMVGGIFVAMLRYGLFNIKIIITEIFVGIILSLLLIELFNATETAELLTRFVLLMLVAVASYFLVRSVYREVESREIIAKQKEEIEKASNEKSEFMTFASHEIRNPITAMRGYASLIVEGDMGQCDPKVKETAKKVLITGNEVLSLISEYLNKSKLELGQIEYMNSTFDVGASIMNMFDGFRPHAESRGLTLISNVDFTQNCKVIGDEPKVKEVIGNLIDNAIKYTAKGSVTVSTERKGDNVVVAIRDTGAGIPAETIPKLFQKFSRADAKKANLLGTGIGLYLAKTFIEGMGGKIWVESPGTDRGSTFFIQLPCAK